MSLRRVTVEELVPASGRATGLADPAARGRFRGSELDTGPPALEPLGVGGILDRGLDLVFARFAAIVLVATLAFLPFQIGGELALANDETGILPLLWAGVELLPQLVILGFVTHLVGCDLLRRPTTVRASLEVALRRLPSAACVYLPWLLITTLGYACCLAPGLALAWLGSAFLPTYLLERDAILGRLSDPGVGFSRWLNGLMHSLARAMRLVQDGPSLLRWTGWFVVHSIINMMIVMTPASVESPPVREQLADLLGTDSGVVFFLLSVVGSSFFGMAAALSAAFAVVYYVDQRVRKEALDFELERAEIAPAGGRP